MTLCWSISTRGVLLKVLPDIWCPSGRAAGAQLAAIAVVKIVWHVMRKGVAEAQVCW